MDLKGQFLHTLLTQSGRAYATEAATLLSEREQLHGMHFLDVVADTTNRLAALGAALTVGRPEAFALEMRWAHSLFAARSVPRAYLLDNLSAMQEVLTEQLPAGERDLAARCLAVALEAVQSIPLGSEQPPLGFYATTAQARELLEALVHGNRATALSLAAEIQAGSQGRARLLLEVLPAVQREIGLLWQLGEIDVAEEHLGSRIIEEILARSAEILDDQPDAPLVLAASVSGNDHDIGLRIIAELLREEGLRVMLLGANTPASTIYQTCRSQPVAALALSVTMLVHLPQTAELIQGFPQGQERPPVVVGGPLFLELDDLHRDLGAEASVRDAASVGKVIRELIG